MKKLIITCILMIMTTLFFAQERWEVYTNTSYVYKSELENSTINISSWGGLEKYKITNNSGNVGLELVKHYSSIDGLSSNEIVDFKSQDGNIWTGSYNAGVSIIYDDAIYVLNAESGLLSNRVTGIASTEDLYFVATDEGVTSYFSIDGIAFPILNKNYTNISTQGNLVSNEIINVEVEDNTLYIASPTGINWVDIETIDLNSSWNSLLPRDLNLDNEFTHLAYKNGKLVVSTQDKLCIINDFPTNSDIEYIDISAEYNNEVLSLEIDSDNNIWFSLGIWDEALTFIEEPTSVFAYTIDSNNNVSPVIDNTTQMIDLNNDNELKTIENIGVKDIKVYDDIVILSTWGKGIIFKYSNQWYTFEPNGIGFNAVSDLSVDQDNLLWVCCGYYGASPLRKGARGVSSFDGTDWETLNINNSPLHSDNINTIAVGDDNRKWFGAWNPGNSNPFNWKSGLASYNNYSDEWVLYNSSGVFEYNESTQDYTDVIPSFGGLASATIASVNIDNQGNIMVSEQSAGIEFLNPDGTEKLTGFTFSNSLSNYSRLAFNCQFGYFFTKGASTVGDSAELHFWNSQELPTTNGANWEYIPISELRVSQVYDFTEITTLYETQVWIASSAGLFMYNGEYWYKYDTVIKRYRWQNSWVVDTRYFVGETKLFGANQTIPKALATDGYGSIWIGTEDRGITKYDTNTENFSNYEKGDYPLLSNSISSLAYEPLSGKLYIGATDGLCSLTVGSTLNETSKFSTIAAYPNPFSPDQGDVLKIVNSPTDIMPSSTTICKIYDLSGQLILELPRNKYQSFTWDGNNINGKKCSSGIYFYVISDNSGKTERGKVALIRGN